MRPLARPAGPHLRVGVWVHPNAPTTTRHHRTPTRALPEDDNPDASSQPSTNPLARLSDAVTSIFDFETWAPRSSRAWRLRQTLDSDGDESDADTAASSMDVLNARLAEARRSRDEEGSDFEEEEQEVDVAIEPAAPPLTGRELGAGVMAKYGRPYDVAIVRRDLAGIRVVAFNVMWSYLGQKSFAMSADGYQERLDAVAGILSSFGCAGEVRAWLAQPPKPKRGLPARPVVGNAVSLRLSVDYQTAGEWLDG